MKTLKKAYYYLQGHVGYFLYIKGLYPKHLEQQVYLRFGNFKSKCYFSNECKNSNCGCDLTAQAFSNKVCEKGSCKYSRFLSEDKWNKKYQENINVRNAVKNGKNRIRI